jgi:hypothetical protein
MTNGTNHFVSFSKACVYYSDYEEDATLGDIMSLVNSKIADGSICIGKPDLFPGEALVLIDDGTRYAIEEAPATSWRTV